MSIESFEHHETIEDLREKYKAQLDLILYKQLTVENINTFADDALTDLVYLNEEILQVYKSNPFFEAFIERDQRTQEDDAYKKLGLPNIQEILVRVGVVAGRIHTLRDFAVSMPAEVSSEVITPPTEGLHKIKAGTEGGGLEERSLIPRFVTLLYILETDFDIPKEQVKILKGQVIPNMVRREPYLRIQVEGLNRVIYICDEEGNATYVFNTEKLQERGITLEDLDVDDKREKNSLITLYPGIGMRIIQTKNWRVNITEALTEIPETSIKPVDEVRGFEELNLEGRVSEFENKKWLPFEDFQKEVRDAYEKETGEKGNVGDWYKKKRINYSAWPYNPDKFYKTKGWVGFPELVGKENFLKKEILSFDLFQQEVRGAYNSETEEKKGIAIWYKNNVSKHIGWPFDPHKVYKGKGWIGFFELVGKENPFKEKPLDFFVFQEEVRSAYDKEDGEKGDVYGWYKKQRSKHKNWPSFPEKTYKEKGWRSWPELVGKESFLRDWPVFEEFKMSVQSAYEAYTGNKTKVKKWYDTERKNKKWPSSPSQTYKNKGWIGWPELVGKESRLKDWLPYDQFKEDVLVAWDTRDRDYTRIKDWYEWEYKKHKNWPHNPLRLYKEVGWKGWPELVKKDKK